MVWIREGGGFVVGKIIDRVFKKEVKGVNGMVIQSDKKFVVYEELLALQG